MDSESQLEIRVAHFYGVCETWIKSSPGPYGLEKSSSVTVLARIVRKSMVVPTVNIRGSWKLDSEFSRYLGFLERLVKHWYGTRKHAVSLLDGNVKPHRHDSTIF